MDARTTIDATRAVRLRPIAFPSEHGSWGLVAEPLALGLLLAPSLAGASMALGAFATFLARRPLKVALANWNGPDARRANIAVAFLLVYGVVAAAGFAAAVYLAGARALAPLLLGSPLVAVFLAYEFRNQSRAWQAELAGVVAFALIAAGIALAAGWPAAPAFALTGALAARAIPSVLYVRSRIRLDRGKPHDSALAVGAHVAALGLVLFLVGKGWLPWLALVPFAVLLARAATGLSARRRPMAVRTIGLTEMGYGILTVIAIVAGY